MKRCTCCKEIKEDDKFRVRIRNGYSYINPTCKKCETVKALKYYHSKKNDPLFAQKNRDNVKRYNKENKELVKEKQKVQRQLPRSKEVRKEYYKNNRDKILSDHRKIANKYAKRIRENLEDGYILGSIQTKVKISREEIRKYPELIKVERSKFLIHREIKKQQNNGTTKEKNC